MTKFQFYLSKARSVLWIRPTIISLAAIVWVGISFFADRLGVSAWEVDIDKETLVNLFSILAATMLTVATFSVAAVATAFGAVATSATPRATSIVMSDSGVQSTLAAFLAAFIYAVVSITSLSAIDFGRAGRFMLFLGFVILVSWVLMSFLRWVDQVSRLGKLGDTLDRVAAEARLAFSSPEMSGLLGGKSHEETSRPEAGLLWRFDRFGYIQHVDMEALQAVAEDLQGEIWLDVRPGSFVTKNGPIGLIRSDSEPDEDQWEKLMRSLSVGSNRSYRTDPRFAMIVLAEVADRALSPAVNDPGTAIAVLTIELELFQMWAENDKKSQDRKEVEFDRLYVPEITAQDLVFDAFTPIARDGAHMIEVCLRLHKALRSLRHMNHDGLGQAAEAYEKIALELSDQALPIASQKKTVNEFARRPLVGRRPE